MPRGGRNRYGEFDKVLDVNGEEEEMMLGDEEEEMLGEGAQEMKSDAAAQAKRGPGGVRGDLDMSDELKQVNP